MTTCASDERETSENVTQNGVVGFQLDRWELRLKSEIVIKVVKREW